MTKLSYVDASALVKLVVEEPGSAAMLRWYVESEMVVTSRIGIIETSRASRRTTHDPERLRRVLDSIAVIECDAFIGDSASGIAPPAVRTLDAIHVATALALRGTLDAIHVATALALRGTLDAFVTYDERLAVAAREAGLPVVVPAV